MESVFCKYNLKGNLTHEDLLLVSFRFWHLKIELSIV